MDTDTHHEIIVGITDATVTLSVNYTGLAIPCGNKVYTGFCPKWSGRYRLEYLVPSVTEYATLNANEMTNSGSFVLKVVPHKCANRESIENPLVYHNSKFFSA